MNDNARKSSEKLLDSKIKDESLLLKLIKKYKEISLSENIKDNDN